MDSELSPADPDPDSEPSPAEPDPPHGDEILDRLIVEEMGEEIAVVMRRARAGEEARYRRQHPDEGLRERKRRLTRQLISDAATTMFATRGFDNVKVSEVADRVGVSEKTIYNYFPTKESLVLDTTDDALADMTRALRERRPDESLTDAVLRALDSDMRRFDEAPDELLELIPMFVTMIETTAALRASWLELYDRLTEVVREELAAQTGLDPRDPEVGVAGRALVGLVQVALESRVRRIGEGLRGPALRAAVDSDVNRAARLLETGLWSFELLARGARAANQARELAQSAEQARAQVVSALRQARAAWAELRSEHAGNGGRSPGQTPAWMLHAQQRSAAAERRQAQRAEHDAQRRAGAERQQAQQAERDAQRRAAAERRRPQRGRPGGPGCDAPRTEN